MASVADLRVAVVGAGLAGLVCARRLADHGAAVTLWDKGRGPAGRASTRREAVEEREVPFDHGAQYFTVRDARFLPLVSRWVEEGVVARWRGRISARDGDRKPGGTERFVGVPGMSALGAHLARGLDVRWGVGVTQVERAADGGGRFGPSLQVRTGPGRPSPPFDRAVVATTAAPVPALLGGVAPGLAETAAAHRMLPCWALMAAVRDPLPVEIDGVFFGEGPLAWAARNSSKPGRPGSPETWVAHAAHHWSTRRLEEDPARVADALLAALRSGLGVPDVRPLSCTAHRWRYARSAEPRGDGCLAGADGSVVLAGDWLAGDRIEGACVSGWTAAERLLENAE